MKGEIPLDILTIKMPCVGKGYDINWDGSSWNSNNSASGSLVKIIYQLLVHCDIVVVLVVKNILEGIMPEWPGIAQLLGWNKPGAQ